MEHICCSCGEEATKKCGHCGIATYCSQKCQEMDWDSIHQNICFDVNSPDYQAVNDLLELVRPGQSRAILAKHNMTDIAEMIQMEYPLDMVDNALSDKLNEWRQRYKDWKLRRKGKKQMARGEEMYNRGNQNY